ncbi:uncharacterized protein IL334_005107 [Kwoniella shivajii]|uniref:Spt20-like SEP domain-containing protein n=1 Tax=Kwoniella shivajii TaxID=564305 RepID=A0ABZ1D3F6_9TREE|nr:hypothetical protein IL334_005107 [Kwoniella shivajii]
MASASGYNHHRFARAVLKKSRKWEPSLTVQLYSNHWKYENSPVHFQYDGPGKNFLLALRSQVIPVSLIPFLYDIQPPISFVDGCLVVELQDFRKTPEVKSRVVMRPAAETLAQTIDVMLERKGQNWDESMGLELESRIIAATSPPLYLGTSLLATRNATLALALTSPAGTTLAADGNIRPTNTIGEHDSRTSTDKLRRLLRAGEKSTQFRAEFNVLRAKEQYEIVRQKREQEIKEAAIRNAQIVNGNQSAQNQQQSTTEQNNQNTNNATGGSATNAAGATVPNGEQGEKKKNKKKRQQPAQPIEEEEEEKPKPKKKKKQNLVPISPLAVAAAEPEPENPPPKKKKGNNVQKDNNTSSKNDTAAEIAPPKKKVPKKKKDESAAGGNTTNTTTTGGGLPLGVGLAAS